MTRYQPNPDLHDPLCKLTDCLIHKVFERDAVLCRRKRQKTDKWQMSGGIGAMSIDPVDASGALAATGYSEGSFTVTLVP